MANKEHHELSPEQIEDLLVEVLSGKLIFDSDRGVHASRAPTMSEQDRGRVIFAKTLRELRDRGLPSRDELEERAVKTGQIDLESRKLAMQLSQQVSRLMKARTITTDPDQRLKIDADLMSINLRLADISTKEWEILRHCAEVAAEASRTLYYTSVCTLGGDLLDEPVWKSWNDFLSETDQGFVDEARIAFVRVSAGLPITTVRAIARSPLWRSRWKAAKESGSPVFSGEASGWDKNRVNLAYWSEFYDAVIRHPDCPPEEVLADDEQLQNWLNTQVQKKQQTKTGTTPKTGPVTYIDGRGNRKAMVRSGEVTRHVGTPYRVRT